LGIDTAPKTMRTPRAGYRAAPARRRGGIALAPGFWRRLLRGRWLVVTILVLLAAGVMVRLGVWQLDRFQGRRAANAAIERQLAAPPLLLDARAAATADPASLTFRRVTVRGTWDYAREVELRYRTFEGQAGVRVLTPLRIDGGETVVLVDRGWIPYQEAGPEGRRAYQRGPSAALEGLVYESHAQSSPSSEPGVFSQVDIQAIGAQLPYPILPYWVKRLPAGDERVPPRAEPPPDLGNGSHLAYMIQWWAFAGTLLITYLIFANATMLRERRAKSEERRAKGEGGRI
jgi:surfeit locus 1 family protein